MEQVGEAELINHPVLAVAVYDGHIEVEQDENARHDRDEKKKTFNLIEGLVIDQRACVYIHRDERAGGGN